MKILKKNKWHGQVSLWLTLNRSLPNYILSDAYYINFNSNTPKQNANGVGISNKLSLQITIPNMT